MSKGIAPDAPTPAENKDVKIGFGLPGKAADPRRNKAERRVCGEVMQNWRLIEINISNTPPEGDAGSGNDIRRQMFMSSQSRGMRGPFLMVRFQA